jgi:hypothetical protein
MAHSNVIYPTNSDTAIACHFSGDTLSGYVQGKRGPHFGLPTIPIEVAYASAFIAVCEMNDPEYKFGIITLYLHS